VRFVKESAYFQSESFSCFFMKNIPYHLVKLILLQNYICAGKKAEHFFDVFSILSNRAFTSQPAAPKECQLKQTAPGADREDEIQNICNASVADTKNVLFLSHGLMEGAEAQQSKAEIQR
jgi:hypothetical protein